jgi:hypothetical protein
VVHSVNTFQSNSHGYAEIACFIRAGAPHGASCVDAKFPLRRHVARRSRARENMYWFLAAMPPKTNTFFRFESEALDFAQALEQFAKRLVGCLWLRRSCNHRQPVSPFGITVR